MIRRATYRDVDSINEIGKELHDNFAYLFKMENVVNTSYSRVYLYEENNKVLGFIHVDSHFEIMDLINIVVLKEYQNNILKAFAKTCKSIEQSKFIDLIQNLKDIRAETESITPLPRINIDVIKNDEQEE